jgi:hypothetical protein
VKRQPPCRGQPPQNILQAPMCLQQLLHHHVTRLWFRWSRRGEPCHAAFACDTLPPPPSLFRRWRTSWQAGGLEVQVVALDAHASHTLTATALASLLDAAGPSGANGATCVESTGLATALHAVGVPAATCAKASCVLSVSRPPSAVAQRFALRRCSPLALSQYLRAWGGGGTELAPFEIKSFSVVPSVAQQGHTVSEAPLCGCGGGDCQHATGADVSY